MAKPEKSRSERSKENSGNVRLIRDSRSVYRRLIYIHHAILSQSFPSAPSLAQELEVSRKTIVRDIEFMRYQLNLSIAYDAGRRGYQYSEPVHDFPCLQLTEGELIAVFIGEKALGQYKGTPFEDTLRRAFDKIANALPAEVSISFPDLDASLGFRATSYTLQDLETFRTLVDATTSRRRLHVAYYTASRNVESERDIDPYHLMNVDGEWYLYAYDHLRKGVRCFSPARIRGLEPTGETFERPEGFHIDDYLGGNFGVMSEGGDYAVRVRFDEWAARFIRERFWHLSQQIKLRRDGGCELRLRLSGLTEFKRWLLSWGDHAEALAPRTLRQEMARLTKEMAEKYERR